MTDLRTAAFFDLDKTIIATSSATAFSKPFLAGGLLTRRDMVRTAYAHLMFQLGSANEAQSERLRTALSTLVAGWDVAQVSAIVTETLHLHIEPTVFAEAVELIEHHHSRGDDVVIVSASGTEVVEPIAAALGADHVIATRMEVVDGRYTGEIAFYAFGENKALAVRELAETHGYDLSRSWAYSDSITDIPLLGAVGHAAVVNADRALRRVAAERGWAALTFARPVALRRNLGGARTTVPMALAVTAGLAALTAELLRRRARSAAAA